jgi:GNAT superfamily N-acetyltransferase
MTSYIDSAADLTPDKLTGFFVGWPNPPSPETHLKLLRGSDHVVLAIDNDTDRCVGFITAISDGVLSACLPLLEVLPAYQGRGIGRELMNRMLHQLKDLYMIDLICDPDLQAYYEQLGMRKASGMMIRNYDRQSGSEG